MAFSAEDPSAVGRASVLNAARMMPSLLFGTS